MLVPATTVLNKARELGFRVAGVVSNFVHSPNCEGFHLLDARGDAARTGT